MPESPPTGYRSARSRLLHGLLVALLAALYLVLQIALPVAALVLSFKPLLLEPFLSGMQMAEMDRAAVWNDRICFPVSGPGEVDSFEDLERTKRTLRCSAPFGGEETAFTFSLPYEEDEPPRLLGGEALHLFSPQGVWGRVGGGWSPVPLPEGVDADALCPPFHVGGRPAVLEQRERGLLLLALEDATWDLQRFYALPEVPSGACAGDRLRSLEIDGTLHLFHQVDGEIRHRPLSIEPTLEEEDDAPWEVVRKAPPLGWQAFRNEDQPAVAAYELIQPFDRRLKIHELLSGGWTETVSVEAGGIAENSIHPFEPEGGLLLAEAGLPGTWSFRLLRGGAIEREQRKGRFFRLPVGPLVLVVGGAFSIVGVLGLFFVFCVDLLVKRFRTPWHVLPSRAARHASLMRRGLARTIDGLLQSIPHFAYLMVILPKLMDGTVFDLLVSQYYSFLPVLGWVALLLLFSFMEGRWGKSPGKALLGIEVCGRDLERCGFGRALVRNILLIVDGFLMYLVGIVLIAMSPHRQRLGDLAGTTIVVRSESSRGSPSVVG